MSAAEVEEDWGAAFGVDVNAWARSYLAETGLDGLLINEAWYEKEQKFRKYRKLRLPGIHAIVRYCHERLCDCKLI